MKISISIGNTWTYKYNEVGEFNMKRNDKEKNKHISIIHENNMIQNLKKYYKIDDHTDLLRFIKKNVTNTNH